MHFLLYGADTYRSGKQLEKFIAEFRARRDPQGYNTIILDGKEATLDEILGHCLVAPFLGEKRLVVVKQISENKDAALLDALGRKLKENCLPDFVVLVFWESTDFEKKPHPLFGALMKEKYSQCFTPLSGSKLIEWVCAQAENNGARCDQAAALLLAEIVGANLGKLELEIHKLAALSRAEGKKILTKEDVHASFGAALDDDVFHFIDALFQGNTQSALRLLSGQRNSGKSEQEIFGALLWQIRTLLEIKDYEARNPRAVSADCARALGIHPYVIKKTKTLLRRASMKFLSTLHEYALLVDKDIKTGTQSALCAFDQMVVNFTQMMQ